MIAASIALAARRVSVASLGFTVALFVALSMFVPQAHAATDCVLNSGDGTSQLTIDIGGQCTTITTAPNAVVTLAPNNTFIIPTSTTLVFSAGSQWMLGASTTVQVSGAYSIPMQRMRVFTLAPGASITSNPTLNANNCPVNPRIVYPEWFGAVVNDGQDDSVAMNQALAMGDSLVLAAGTYDVQNRIPLLNHQSIFGAGKGVTTLSQMANFNLVAYTPNVPPYSDILVQDFQISLTSDCNTVSDLTIDGTKIPNGTLQPNATWGALMTAIQISSHYGWRLGQPPVRNVQVLRVSIVSPLSGCINIQSDRGVDGVLIDGVTCTARSTGGNTFGLTIEGYHPWDANPYSNVTIQNSTFDGGTSVFYIAGVTNFVVDNTSIIGENGTVLDMLYYTGDVGFKSTSVFRNSTFSYMNPSANAEAVMRIQARGYVKDYENVFPYLQEVGTSLTMQNDTIQSAPYGATTTIPLIKDWVGTHDPIVIASSTLIGGSYGILAGDTASSTIFGATVFADFAGGIYTQHEITDAEIAQYQVKHSSFNIWGSTFANQAIAGIWTKLDNVSSVGNTFTKIGASPLAAGFSAITIGQPSPYDATSTLTNTVQNNRYWLVNNPSFVTAAASANLSQSNNTTYFDPIAAACPSNYLKLDGTCTFPHIITVSTTTNSLQVFVSSWVKPALVYAINYGDGVEVQIPNCVQPYPGQPTSCMSANPFTHNYAKAGTYSIQVLNYACLTATSTPCSVLVDKQTVTVTALAFDPILAGCPTNYIGSNGLCQVSHLIFVATTTNSLTATTSSFMRPGLPYALNYGDGVEISAPGCIPINTTMASTSCTGPATIAHAYAQSGTYLVSLLNYGCRTSTSTPCSVLVDKQTVTVLKTATPPPPAPVVTSFSANPATVTAGQSATLSWSTTNATTFALMQGSTVVAQSGTSVQVTPTATTTYTLLAYNGGTATTSASVTVNVAPVVVTPPAFDPIAAACPTNMLTNGVCSQAHLLTASVTSGSLTVNFSSWIKSGTGYAINYGDGVEVSAPTCASSGTTCTSAASFSHTYAQAGTYNVSIINYPCRTAPAGTCSLIVDKATVTVSATVTSPPPFDPIAAGCPSNMLTNGVCAQAHLISATTNTLTTTVSSWMKPGANYALNYGDGVEISAPACTGQTSGPTSCTTAASVTHTYAKAGTYPITLLNYACVGAPAGTCSVLVDKVTVTVGATGMANSTMLANILGAFELFFKLLLGGN